MNICFGTVLFIYNRRHGKIWLKKEYVVFALSFNLPLLLHYISQYILEQFDRVMIQKLVGIAQAGIFSVAYNAGIMMKIVTQSINNALVPWQYEQLEKKNFKEIDNVLFAVFLLIGGCALIFSAFAPEIMKILAAVSKVFNTKRISLLAVSILFVGLILIGLYDKIIIRYLFIICGLGTLYFKRKQIINISKLVQRK